MKRIAVTGGLATGKTSVVRAFGELGAATLSADDIVHDLLRDDHEIKRRAVEAFGKRILGASGEIDRRRVGAIVFDDAAQLKRLTEILYPAVRREIVRRFDENERAGRTRATVAEVPMLIEGGALELYDVIVVVTVDSETQVRRYFEKGGMSRADFEARIRHQLPMEDKIKVADYVIDNSGSREATRRQVEAVWEALTGPGSHRRPTPKGQARRATGA